MKINKTLFLLNVVALTYFIFLVAISELQWDWQPIQIIGEIITLPSILFVIFCIFYSIYHLIRKTRYRFTVPILFISLISIMVIAIATYNQL